jgi:phage-related protein
MATAVFINETSLADLAVYVVGLPGSLDGLGRDFPTLAIPGRHGVVFAADPTVAPRQLRIECTVSTLTAAARQASERQLKALAARGLVQITIDDDVNSPLTIEAVGQSCTVSPKGHPLVAVVSDVSLQFICPDPTWRDVLGVTVGFNTTPVMVPLGTATSGGIVRIAAPSWSANVVDPILYYLNVAKATVQSMTFTVTLVAGEDFIEIDLDRSTITLSDNGVRSDAATLLTAGDFFVLDPMDGDPINAGYPYLMLASSAGTPSGQWTGPKRYL